jgi:hypothetical protein
MFLLGAPICFFGAGAYSYAQPKLYRAATGFQLLYPSVDAPRLQDAFENAKQQFPSRIQEPLTARTKLQQSGAPDQYFITAIDTSPIASAYAANTLTLFVTDSLREWSKEDGKRVIVFQKAEMPKVPSFPNVQRIMTVGIAAASFSGAVGVGFLFIALPRRFSN